MKKEYELILKNAETIKCDIRELFNYNSKLLLVDSNGKELYCCNNIQSLYLYPLSIVDYISNLSIKKIISLNIIEIDELIDYVELLSRNEFNSLKAVEILIKDTYSDKQINKISEIIQFLSKRKILVSLNIKNICKLNSSLISFFKNITYFKIFLDNMITPEEYQLFLDKLSLIRKESNNSALLHVKTYINLNQVKLYNQIMNDFVRIGVDVFQVSKELIPLDTENILVNDDNQQIIRQLEEKYSSNNQCRFISVRDISILYYPRFELDERNSRKCYASKMKPYLYSDNILPCKVAKVLNNISEWKLDYNNSNHLNQVFDKCGTTCDDCASIFENDLLYDVEEIISANECRVILKEQ